MIKVIFMGSPPIAKESLKALNESPQFDVVAAITQPDRPSGRGQKLKPTAVKSYCKAANIFCLSPLKSSAEEFLTEFKKLTADVVIVTAFGQILPQKLLDFYPQKFINVHASILPRWRGAAPIQRAIMAGDLTTGVSLQVMVKNLDAGDVIGEAHIDIGPNESALNLHDRLQALIPALLEKHVAAYLKGEIQPQPQDSNLVTYAHKIEKSEAWIDWELSSDQIYKNYLGLSLGPGVKSELGSESYKFKIIKPLETQERAKPGTVTHVLEESFRVQCGQGEIEVFEIQKQSQKSLKVAEFLKGQALNIGDVFMSPKLGAKS